ncbi:hypothetical protein OG729_13675 [Streptomyces sp. NBC_00210]|uniref:DUF7379 domain-containing protein n=1 Tax=Streptomyces sp. NBC_00210 TaxID=2903636 RepID=UPI0032528AA9
MDHDGRAGIVRASVFQRLGAPEKQRRDPTFNKRLAHWLAKLEGDADEHPEVSDLPDRSLANEIVFIHGALSCGLANLPSLKSELARVAAHRRILRFEHDTFLPIDNNGEQLSRILRKKLSADSRAKVVLVGHSRGGLVARWVANDLLDAGYAPDRIRVVTFGTPHEGTPIVNASRRVLSGLATLATFAVRSVTPDPATPLVTYLFGNAKKLPEGISVMAKGNSVLREINRRPVPFRLRAYGATYHKGTNPRSRGVAFLDSQGRNLFIENRTIQPNDLLVTVKSATAVGEGQTMSDPCGHFGYLAQPEAMQAIINLLKP